MITNDFVVAADDIEEDETLFSIPHSAVLNVKNAISTFLPENSSVTLAALRDMPSWLVCFPAFANLEKSYYGKLTAQSHLLLS
jgi:hypothetical protein